MKQKIKSEHGGKTYAEAVERGDYNLYIGNIFGKYDNVRTYWEDMLTRYVLRPYLSELVDTKKQKGEKVRIVDLGCGAGQGYQILTQIDKRDIDLGLEHDRVLPEKLVEIYLGVDLSKPMVDQGNKNFASKPNVKFIQGNLTEGLTSIKGEKPFDIYFSSYGSFSHLNTKQLTNLLKDICSHSSNGSLVVLDLLGRYSIEWPCYWDAKTDEEKIRDYSMSYLYPASDRNGTSKDKIEHFPIRFWTGGEISETVSKISKETSIKIELLRNFDRSILAGRHTDTREYNPKLPPMRSTINNLHTDYLRTDLNKLILSTDIFPKHKIISTFLEELIKSWNIVVRFCQNRLTEQRQSMPLVEMEGWSKFSSPLQLQLLTMDRVISSTSWMWTGEPRANIIEPQLGYALRGLEADLQKGLGCGHALLVALRIKK